MSKKDNNIRADWMPVKDIPIFLKLYERLVTHYKTRDKALKAIGMSRCTLYRMRQDKMSKSTGTLILNAFNAIKNKEPSHDQ